MPAARTSFSGSVSGATSPRTLTMTAPASVTASFTALPTTTHDCSASRDGPVTKQPRQEMLDNELLKGIDERLTRMEAAIEAMATPKVQARYLDIKGAGEYLSKTYEAMRYTMSQYPKELPVAMISDKPSLDVKDIDRLMLNRKGR